MSFQPGATAGGASIDSLTISYVEFNTDVTISATTEATANTVVTAAAFVANGVDLYWVEFFVPGVTPAAVATAQCYIVIYDNGAALGGGAGIAQVVTPAAATMIVPVLARRRLTPAAGSHAYSIRAYAPGGNGSVRGTAAGTGQPGYISITRAA